MAYEVFTKKTVRLGTPTLSFSRIGQVSFNQTAARALKDAKVQSILILWDATEGKLALKSIADAKDVRAYTIRYNDKGNGASFSAKTFLDHVGIDYSERKPFPIDINADKEMFLEVRVPDVLLKKKSAPVLVAEKVG